MYTYLKATGVLELVPLVARLRLEVSIASQYLLSPLLDVLRVLEDLHLLRRNLIHSWQRIFKIGFHRLLSKMATVGCGRINSLSESISGVSPAGRYWQTVERARDDRLVDGEKTITVGSSWNSLASSQARPISSATIDVPMIRPDSSGARCVPHSAHWRTFRWRLASIGDSIEFRANCSEDTTDWF